MILFMIVIIKYMVMGIINSLSIIVIDDSEVIINTKRVIIHETPPSFDIVQNIKSVMHIKILNGILNISKDPIINDCPLPPLNFMNTDQL